MTSEEYEIVLGKLSIIKLFLLKKHRDEIDAIMENLEVEYLERKNKGEL